MPNDNEPNVNGLPALAWAPRGADAVLVLTLQLDAQARVTSFALEPTAKNTPAELIASVSVALRLTNKQAVEAIRRVPWYLIPMLRPFAELTEHAGAVAMDLPAILDGRAAAASRGRSADYAAGYRRCVEDLKGAEAFEQLAGTLARCRTPLTQFAGMVRNTLGEAKPKGESGGRYGA